MNIRELMATFGAHRRQFERSVALPPSTIMYLPEEWKNDYTLAMDALPTLTTVDSAGIPAILTTTIDPTVFRVLFAPNKAAEIWGNETQRGTWLDDTILFPLIEATGETSSYGDYN